MNKSLLVKANCVCSTMWGTLAVFFTPLFFIAAVIQLIAAMVAYRSK